VHFIGLEPVGFGDHQDAGAGGGELEDRVGHAFVDGPQDAPQAVAVRFNGLLVGAARREAAFPQGRPFLNRILEHPGQKGVDAGDHAG